MEFLGGSIDPIISIVLCGLAAIALLVWTGRTP